MNVLVDTSTDPVAIRHFATTDELIDYLIEKESGSCSFMTNLPINPLTLAQRLLKHFRAETLSFSTFTLPTEVTLKDFRELHENGIVKTINAIVPGHQIRTSDIISRGKTVDLCRLTGGYCKALQNHSKTLTIEGERNITILASSNFAGTQAIENYTVIYGIETAKAVNEYFQSKFYD